MNRAAQTTLLLGRRFGHSIVAALLHVLPPNLSSWKLALYVTVFLLPSGSFVVLGAAWFENRRLRQNPAALPSETLRRLRPAAPLMTGRAYAASAIFATPEHRVTTRNRIRTACNTQLPFKPLP